MTSTESEHQQIVAALTGAGIIPAGTDVRQVLIQTPDGVYQSVAAGPQPWSFSATVDWSGAETPTPRTGIADLVCDGVTGLAARVSEDNLSVYYTGQINAAHQQSAQDAIMAAGETVAANSTPQVPGWGVSCTVWR